MQFANPGAVIENTIRKNLLKTIFSEIGQSGTLLDLGCGTRPFYEYYAPHFEKTIGADLAESPFPKKQIDIYCPATDVPLPTGSIDVILCTEVLQDIAEPSELIIESFRLLKPGGKLILTCPFMVPIADGVYDHYRFTRYGLNYQLTKGGFTVLDIIPESDAFGAAITMQLKPILKFWNILAKLSGINAIYRWYNPLFFISVLAPQLLYLFTAKLPLFKQFYRRFNYGAIGYVSVSVKP
jgi:ubiquinone/menaquinone biosynthesis C-methylase UbiE